MQFKTKWVIACLLLLLAPSLSLAKSAETLRSENPWYTFQGNSEHTGYMPVYLANPDIGNTIDVPSLEWVQNNHVAPLIRSTCKTSGSNRWIREYIYEFPDSDCVDSLRSDFLADITLFIYIEPLLNQATVVEDMVLITNKGYKVPHGVWARDADDGGTLNDYYGYDRDYDLNFDFYPNNLCPISQSQPSMSEGFLMNIQTNVFEIFDDAYHICSMPLDLVPPETYTHFRTYPFDFKKGQQGTELLQFNSIADLQIPVLGNQFDTYTAPAPYLDSVYFIGGGSPSSRRNGGMYGYTLDDEAPVTKNLGSGFLLSNVGGDGNEARGFPSKPNAELATDAYPLSPSDTWSPAVSGDYLISYTQYQLDQEAPDFTDERDFLKDIDFTNEIELSYEEQPGAVLSIVNRHTGETLYEYDDIRYSPKLAPIRDEEYTVDDVQNVFHLERSPVIVGNSVLVTAENTDGVGYLRSFRIVDDAADAASVETTTATGSGFVGQVSVSANASGSLPIVYGVANNELVGRIFDNNSTNQVDSFTPLLDTVTSAEWRWVPPVNETIYPPFVVTETHAFVSTDENVYMVDLNLATPLADRTSANLSSLIPDWEPNPSYLALNYNRLIITTSTSFRNALAEAVADITGSGGTWDGTNYTRPAIASYEVLQAGILDNNSRVIAMDFVLSTAAGADVAVSIPTPDLSVVPEGSALSYEMEVTNNGPEDATGVKISSTQPVGLKFTGFTIPDAANIDTSQRCGFSGKANAFFECTLLNLPLGAVADVTLTGIGLTREEIRFTANAEPQEVDAVRNNNDVSQTNQGAPGADSANLVLIQASFDASTASQGDTVILSFSGRNDGSGDENVSVSSAAPTFTVDLQTHFEFDSAFDEVGVDCLEASGIVTCTYNGATGQLEDNGEIIEAKLILLLNDPDPLTPGPASVQVELSSTTFDILPTNNSDDVSLDANPAPSLMRSITHEATSSNEFGVEDEVTVTYSLNNSGGKITNGVLLAQSTGGITITENTLSSALSGATCTRLSSTTVNCTGATIEGSSNLSFDVSATSAASGTVSFFLDGDQLPPSTTAEGVSDSQDFVVVQPVDIGVSLGSMNRNLNIGDYTTFPLTITNTSGAAAENVSLMAQFPVTMSVTSTSNDSCSAISNQLECSLGTIAANGSVSVNVQIQAKDSSTTSPVTFTITTTSVENSTDEANNSVTSEAIVIFGESPTGSSGSITPWMLLVLAGLMARVLGRRKNQLN